MIFINDMPIKHFTFPGGEVHVEIPFLDPKFKETTVLAHLRSSDDVMKLMLVMNAIQNQGVEDVVLHIPYFPYARQDRICGFGQAFSLKVMVAIINSFECNTVIIFDPHSTVIKNLLCNVKYIPQHKLLLFGGQGKVRELIERENLVLVCPDEGARGKVSDIRGKLLDGWDIKSDIIFCGKERDLATGEIIKTIVPQEIDHGSFIIIDDICDGGRSFVEIVKAAKRKETMDRRYLYVTHGIFSRGLDYLKDHFDHVFCVNCFLPEEIIASEKAFLTVMDYEV